MEDDLARINALTEQRVERLLSQLCEDPSSRNFGGFLTDDTNYADSRNSIFAAQTLFAAYLYPDYPKYYSQPWLLEKLRMHLQFVQNRQRESGTINLWIGGAASGNEIGFTLPGVCETYRRIQASNLPGQEEIADVFRNYILKGAEAVRTHFPHTANHRWTACTGPLAIANSLFPDPQNVEVIEDYLSDGIDMDTDGLYYEERSPNYNKVANWGLLYLADYYDRKDLLAHIDRNLRFILKMIQPSGEAETLFSHRQDRGAAGSRWGDYYLFKRMAVETGDGEFAQAADDLLETMTPDTIHSPFIPLRYLFDDPRIRTEAVPRRPLSTNIELRLKDNPIWRFRKGAVAATVVADAGGHFFDITQGTWGGLVRSDAVMSYHAGDAIIDAVKMRWGIGTGGFRPDKIEYLGNHSLRLSYRDPGWDHVAHYRPREKWGPRHVDVNLYAAMTLRWTDEGSITMEVEIDGWNEMPVNFQLLLRENCSLLKQDGTRLDLKKNGRTYTDGGTCILEGPSGNQITIEGLPASESRIPIGESRVIPGLAEKRCHRLIVSRFTPVKMTITFFPQPRMR